YGRRQLLGRQSGLLRHGVPQCTVRHTSGCVLPATIGGCATSTALARETAPQRKCWYHRWLAGGRSRWSRAAVTEPCVPVTVAARPLCVRPGSCHGARVRPGPLRHTARGIRARPRNSTSGTLCCTEHSTSGVRFLLKLK